MQRVIHDHLCRVGAALCTMRGSSGTATVTPLPQLHHGQIQFNAHRPTRHDTTRHYTTLDTTRREHSDGCDDGRKCEQPPPNEPAMCRITNSTARSGWMPSHRPSEPNTSTLAWQSRARATHTHTQHPGVRHNRDTPTTRAQHSAHRADVHTAQPLTPSHVLVFGSKRQLADGGLARQAVLLQRRRTKRAGVVQLQRSLALRCHTACTGTGNHGQQSRTTTASGLSATNTAVSSYPAVSTSAGNVSSSA